MTVTVESVGSHYSIKGHLYPLQWWVLSCLISASATNDFTEHYAWTNGNGVTYLRNVSWYEQSYFCAENNGKCFARFEFQLRPYSNLKPLGNLSESSLVAIEFTVYGGICDEKRKRIEQLSEIVSDGEWFRFDGGRKEKFYLFLRMDTDPLNINRQIKEIKKAEMGSSIGSPLFSEIQININILPCDFIVSEMLNVKDSPRFYLVTEPDKGQCLKQDNIVLFDSESQLKNALVKLLDQPSKKIISSGVRHDGHG
jgi:hypothetical protein